MVEVNSHNLVLEAALDLHRRKIPITLCRADKRPIGMAWQSHEYSSDSIREAFESDPSLNVGIILGNRSGIIDIEGDENSSEDDLLELFDGNIPETPSYRSRRGIHRLFKWDDRLDAIGLASMKVKGVEIRLGANRKAAHSLVPPSCTDDYEREWIMPLDDCDLASVPEIVIQKLVPPPKPQKTVTGGNGSQNRPGDDFNRNGDSWAELLLPHGWVSAGDDGKGTSYWRRPGKSDGISATAGHCKTDDGQELFYVFSSNAPPLEAGTAYAKFSLLAFLNYDGDFSVAAGELASRGFGKPQGQPKESVANKIVAMIQDDSSVELFHSPEGVAYMTFGVNGHKETEPLDSKELKDHISSNFYRQFGKVPNASAVNDAIATLSGMARYEGEKHEVHIRVAEAKGAIYIDRGSPDWDAYKVTPEGYELVQEAPVKFQRFKGVKELPIAVAGGSIKDLEGLVNVPSEQFPLLVAGILSYLKPSGPYPCMVITGEQGTAKSTLATLVRRIVDPNICPLRSEPKCIKDLMVTARCNWLVVLDNISKLPPWQSDTLCRLATGGGISDRSLYTNGDEYVIEAQRPVVLTSIADVVVRPDLVDRSLLIELEPIRPENRLTEREHCKKVEEKLPLIFGAFLEALSTAMANEPNVQLVELPRMADFARFATAAEPAFGWDDGAFMNAYRGNQSDAHQALLESTVAQAVTGLVDTVGHWSGTPTELHTQLTKTLSDERRGEDWPSSARILSGELARVAPVLRDAGYLVSKRKSNGTRVIDLSKAVPVIGA